MPVHLAGLLRRVPSRGAGCATVRLALAPLVSFVEGLSVGYRRGKDDLDNCDRDGLLDLKVFCNADFASALRNPRCEVFAVTTTMSTCVEE